MPPAADSWPRIKQIFDEAVELHGAERLSFLNRVCAGDETLRQEVESLLESDRHADNFIEAPAGSLPRDLFPSDVTEALAGRDFGAYKIIQEIGRGGLGAVYLARRADDAYHKEVAIKLIRRGLDTDDILRRFRDERQILARLDHPNIARLIDGGTTADGLPYFVMDYVEGEAITTYCETRRLTSAERIPLFRKVCAAVTYAHQHLVIHRDLKPSNIIVTADGEPKLLDFGIAKLLAPGKESFNVTAADLRMMTPEYASPEQVRGEPVTTASDVYSLGVLLYEILTGEKPYQLKTGTAAEVARVLDGQKPARPSTAAGKNQPAERRGAQSLRGDLDNIVLMALRQEPARRYSSVAQFSEDLRRHLDRLPVVARRDTFAYRATKFAARNRVGVAAATIVLLSLVAGVIVGWSQANIARHERDLARRERVKAERINEFLQRMLSFSNQSVTSVSPVAQSKNVTVNEMLAQIVPQLRKELADQPAIRAEILHTIGNSYASQGQYEPAETNLREALETQQQLEGRIGAQSASTMLDLAAVRMRVHDAGEATVLSEKALAFYRADQHTAHAAGDAVKLVQALDGLGVMRSVSGDYKAAFLLLNEAWETCRASHLQAAQPALCAAVETDLGGLLVLSGETKKGKALLADSLAEFRKISNQPRWEVGATLTMLGVAAIAEKQPEEAEQLLAEGEQLYRQTLGDSNLYVAFNLDQQAIALFLKHDPAAAEAKARAAVTTVQSFSSANKASWIEPLSILADLLAGTGRAKEAEEDLRAILKIEGEQPKPRAPVVIHAQIKLSQSLLAQDRPGEATACAREAHEHALELLGERNPLTQTAAKNLQAIDAQATTR